jgi:4-amino-4-deoxy-L-arabinose transferase-like glycosyltransferase
MTETIIFLLAFFIRTYKLSLFPLNSDEANFIIPCVNNFDKFFGIPITCFKGHMRPFLGYLVFFSKKVFLNPIYAVRVPAAIIGALTVLLIFKLGKEMYDKKTGVIASSLLCFLPWHVIQSRDGREMILTPFFACLLAFSLLRSTHKKSNYWFILFWFFLGVGSFYTYNASVLFVPIFLITLLWLRKDFYWVRREAFLVGIGAFLITVYPLIYLYIIGAIPKYLYTFCLYWGSDKPLGSFTATSRVFLQLIEHFKNNNPMAFETLFFTSRGRLIFGPALNAPLLISNLTLLTILPSLAISFWRRKTPDKILLIWLVLGYIGGIAGPRCFCPRLIITVLAPLLLLISWPIAAIFHYAQKSNHPKRNLLTAAGMLLCIGLLTIEIFQLLDFYRVAPYNFEQWRRYSYGCEETAQYLLSTPDIKDYQIVADRRMTVFAYLDFLGNGKIKHKEFDINSSYKKLFVVIWAPESHPADYQGGEYRDLWKLFKRSKYADIAPYKTIYYPNGLPAIYIIKIENYHGE